MIDEAQAEIALDRVGGHPFERFFHSFMVAIYGDKFVPLGGFADGGADAFIEPVYGAASRFLQASITNDHRAKITQTIARLREVGRDPKELTYCTSRKIDRVDQEDDYLSTELDVTIRIRDQRWIISSINQSPATQAAFNNHLKQELAFLGHVGAASLLTSVNQESLRTLFVFLEQELSRRGRQTDVLNSTIDSLILWALEGTDPDKKIFMTRREILQKIEDVLPSSKVFVRGSLDHRLERLSSRNNDTGREIRHHRKDDLFCLPFETRKIVEHENVDDELLKKHFLEGLRSRARPYLLAGDAIEDRIELAVSVAHTALEKTFEYQGMELAAFVEGGVTKEQQLSIAEYAEDAVAGLGLDPALRSSIKEAAVGALRGALYESSAVDREYLNKLSRTFALLFTLRSDGKVVDYFRSMSTRLVLYVGADLIVRALSEHYLRPEDQMTVNMLRILRDSGAKLILGYNALEEVWSNMKASDHEFNNWFKWSESHTTLAVVRHCSKILVRSYFYAKLSAPEGVEPPSGWVRYIDQFTTYSSLHSQRGRDELRDYLCRKFGMDFEDTDRMHSGVDPDHLRALQEMILEVRGEKEKADLLAYNDALQVLRVYAKRKEIDDRQTSGIFGYRAWWLTHETHVMRVTTGLIKHYNARFIMRPEFVLNFIAFAPTMMEVRNAYSSVFPSMLSIRLSNRLRDDVFHDILGRYKRACEYDPARIEVKTIELTNRLKGDNFKEYEAELRNGGA